MKLKVTQKILFSYWEAILHKILTFSLYVLNAANLWSAMWHCSDSILWPIATLGELIVKTMERSRGVERMTSSSQILNLTPARYMQNEVRNEVCTRGLNGLFPFLSFPHSAILMLFPEKSVKSSTVRASLCPKRTYIKLCWHLWKRHICKELFDSLLMLNPISRDYGWESFFLTQRKIWWLWAYY